MIAKPTDAQYMEAIRQMVLKARAWIAENPQANAIIQFNYPRTVMLAAAIEDAIEKHFVTVNEDGAKWLAAMWEGVPDEQMPSAFVVRMTMELLDDKSLE